MRFGNKGAGPSWLAIIIVVALISGGLVGFATDWTFKFGPQEVTQTQTCPDGTVVLRGATCPTPSDEGCNVNPTVVLAASDALQPGTSVTVTGAYKINGLYTGTTSPTTRGTMDVIVQGANYLNRTLSGVPVRCGSNLVSTELYRGNISTQTIYKDTGISVLTNAVEGGAVNESAASTGGQYNWKVHMVGVDKRSTGTMLFVVDFTAPSANVSSVSLTPITGAPSATEVAVPKGYTTQTSGGYSKAWLIPAIVGANTVDYNLQAQANTGYYIRDTVYTTTYSLVPFVETDGSFNPGNTGWDSLGTAKYFDKTTYNFCINTGGTAVVCS